MLLHWIWLATRPNMNDREKRMLLEHFRDPEDVFYAGKEAFSDIEELTGAAFEALQDKDLKQARAIQADCARKNIHICTYADGAYPNRLRNIADPPLVLYYKGTLPDFDGVPVIGMVGTRSATAYGMTAARRLGGQIAKCGGMVVSGIASGIDGAAMAGALSAGGTVVGVLGCGVDVVYPQSNRGLFEDTQRYGCLISEFTPGTRPLKWNFPKRNRIISGLSNGVLVVEAPERSGALITARQAAEQGRDVFVVPGNIDVASCAGSNALLREGAIAVSSGWDVVSEYQHLYPEVIGRVDLPEEPAALTEEPPKVAQRPETPAKIKPDDGKKQKITIDNGDDPPYSDIQDPFRNLGERERKVAELLGEEGLPMDEVIVRSGLPAGMALAILSMLEIKGVAKRLPGKLMILKKRKL